MRTNHRSAWIFLAAAALFGAGYSASSFTSSAGAAEKEKHPAIHAGLRNLREAKASLAAGDNDFKGHRIAAIKLIDQAIDECQLCLKID